MGRNQSSIKAAASNLGGTCTLTSKGIETCAKRDGYLFTIRVEEVSDSLIRVRAWSNTFQLPEDPERAANWAFYMQIVNANAQSGRMAWDDTGHCGYVNTLILSQPISVNTLSRVTEETLAQLVQAWPGMCSVCGGASPDVAFIEHLEKFEPMPSTPVRRSSPEMQSIESYARACSLPFKVIDGGIEFAKGDFEIQMSADNSGRFTIRNTCVGQQVPHTNNLATSFYAGIVNSNGSLGTIYVDPTTLHPVSRLNLFVDPGGSPAENIIHYGLIGTVYELGPHAHGMQRVARGEGIMDVYGQMTQAVSARMSQ